MSSSIALRDLRDRVVVRPLPKGIRASWAVGISSLLCVLCVSVLYPTFKTFWSMWSSNALKSIGALVPVISFLLILRVWRSRNWEMKGTWWGFALLALITCVVYISGHMILELVLSPTWTIFLPPLPVVAVTYTAGMVLLFGGAQLLRAAWFPVALTWLVNPVPNAFNLLLDMPLQHAAAVVTRGFAHMLGHPLTANQLTLMFSPKVGMFIAPGCDGLRGAVAMGFVALITGYLYQFRPRAHAALVAGAVLLGYVFNLLRLCSLVIFYIIAAHAPSLSDKGERADYIIGGLLFFIASALLFTRLLRSRASKGMLLPQPEASREPGLVPPTSLVPKWLACVALILVALSSYGHDILFPQPVQTASNYAEVHFPGQIGAFTLQREWDTFDRKGVLLYHWADYATASAPDVISVGVSPTLGFHDARLCHMVEGEESLWHGSLAAKTEEGPVNFSLSFYNNDSAVDLLEASTICSEGVCGQYADNRTHFGLVYTPVDPHALYSREHVRPLPVLLRAYNHFTEQSPQASRVTLTRELESFLAHANLSALTTQYR